VREFLPLKVFVLELAKKEQAQMELAEKELDSMNELGVNFIWWGPMFVFGQVAKVSSAMEEDIVILPVEEDFLQ
jgi:hypothetical protein